MWMWAASSAAGVCGCRTQCELFLWFYEGEGYRCTYVASLGAGVCGVKLNVGCFFNSTRLWDVGVGCIFSSSR